jgi:AcrR family transcriptional regulator
MSLKAKNDARMCILNTAAKLFSKLGIDRTSTRDISKESQANISLISYHFGGKEGLYKQVIKEFALKIQEQMKPVIEQFNLQEMTREIFIREVTTIIDNMIMMRKAHPEISKILSREKIEGMPLSKEVHEEIFYPLIQKFFELFRAAQKNKIVKSNLNPAVFFILLTEGLWGFYEIIECGTSLRNDCNQFYNDNELFKKQILEIFLSGVLV